MILVVGTELNGQVTSQREIKQSNFAIREHSTDVAEFVLQYSNSLLQNWWIDKPTLHFPGNNQYYAAASKNLTCYTVIQQLVKMTQFFMTLVMF